MADTETTPAPTLEELPPEKGTILELHSISEEYDGMLVEYEREDKEQLGKCFVVPLKEEDRANISEGMRVKIKCCKRPDIKPLKLRRVLFSLATSIAANMAESHSTLTQGQQTNLYKILEKDPCCVPAYLAFADSRWVYNDDALSEEERDKKIETVVIPNGYRGIANVYAYQEFSEFSGRNWGGLFDVARANLTFALSYSGHHKSALRAQDHANSFPQELQEVFQEFLTGNKILESAKKLFDSSNEREKQERAWKQIGKFKTAGQHYLKCLQFFAEQEHNDLSNPRIRHIVQGSIADLGQAVGGALDATGIYLGELMTNHLHAKAEKDALSIGSWVGSMTDDLFKLCLESEVIALYLESSQREQFESIKERALALIDAAMRR